MRQFDISAFGASVDGPGESFVVNDVTGVNLLINFSANIGDGQQLRIDVHDNPSDPFDPEGIFSSLDVAANPDDSRVSANLVNSVSIFGQAQDLGDPPPDWWDGDYIVNNPPPDYGGTDEDGDGDSDDDDHFLWFAKQLVPKVSSVSIGGPNPLDGANGVYSIPSGDGEQIRTVPVGGADLIKMTFNRPMDEATLGNALSLEGAHTSTDYTANVVFQDYDPFTFTATWEYTPGTANDMFPADQMVLTLADTATDFAGQQLDGEWTNPDSLTDSGTSVFPSGNGFEGGEFELFFTNLPGDNDRDNVVSGSDFLAWQIHWDPIATDKNFEQSDFDGDGDVDGNDLALWEANYGLVFNSFSGAIAERIVESLNLNDVSSALVGDTPQDKHRSLFSSRENRASAADTRIANKNWWINGGPSFGDGDANEYVDVSAVDQGLAFFNWYDNPFQSWPDASAPSAPVAEMVTSRPGTPATKDRAFEEFALSLFDNFDEDRPFPPAVVE